jgi:hypothetical protein
MFPFRRGGGKKRGKPQGQGPGGGRRQGGGGRRIPNSAAELLGTLQPTTKSLAQVLAGNTRASGQIVHARNVLGQAERMVDERAVDRLPPKQREEFLEQLARLKLTLADADDLAEAEAERDEPAPAPPPVSMDRLRELALSLASGSTPGETAPTDDGEAAPAAATLEEAMPTDNETKADEAGDAERSAPPAAAAKPARGKRGDTLRLKTVRPEADEESGARRAETVR